MTILTLPPITAMRQHFMLVPNSRTFASPLDGTEQTLLMPGTAWRMRLEYPRLTGDNRALMEAFLALLEGQASRVYIFDYSRRFPRGTALGTPLVKGGSQLGSNLITDGWQSGQPECLKPGDWFAVDTSSGRELKKVTQVIAADGDGEATLVFKPSLRKAPADNAGIILQEASGIFRPVDDLQQGWTAEPARRATGIAPQFVETFTG